jgi:hypothetical protein
LPSRAAGPFDYEKSVFINCPFDGAYKPIFEAIVFAVFDCGFQPRCALEADDAGQVRMEKIFDLIADCRLAINDLSRTDLDPATNLPRFNMPLELGRPGLAASPDSSSRLSSWRQDHRKPLSGLPSRAS